MMKPYFLLLLFAIKTISVFSFDNIDIALFYNTKIENFTLTVIKGEYKVFHKTKPKAVIEKKEIIYVSLIDNYLQVRDKHGLIGTYKSFTIKGQDKENGFSITPLFTEVKPRQYDDNLKLSVKNGSIEIINQVDFEKYIAGVVESEAGSTSELEFYKSQALICRTYAYKNTYRHGEEGFHLCDGIHCQAYKGSSFYTKLIPKATFSTRSLIIVDTTYEPINAAFHANSGGLTANSEDVWLSAKYYLRSIEDPYSLKGKQATWSNSISIVDWKKYLKSQGYSFVDEIPPYSFKSENNKRRSDLDFGVNSIRFTKIRSDLRLKSSFFSVKPEPDQLIFEGRGYGHGVGLSQEGGMEMARQGKSFEDIIHFYYQNVRIMSFKELKKLNGKEY